MIIAKIPPVGWGTLYCPLYREGAGPRSNPRQAAGYHTPTRQMHAIESIGDGYLPTIWPDKVAL